MMMWTEVRPSDPQKEDFKKMGQILLGLPYTVYRCQEALDFTDVRAIL
jgi:hypothetical protein